MTKTSIVCDICGDEYEENTHILLELGKGQHNDTVVTRRLNLIGYAGYNTDGDHTWRKDVCINCYKKAMKVFVNHEDS